MGKRARLALRGFGTVAALVLLVLAVGVLVPARALADEPTTVASGNVSSTVTWKIDSEGLLSIEGTGDADLSRGDTHELWGDYFFKITQVSISKTVNITDLTYAFEGCSYLTSVDTSGWNIDENATGFCHTFDGCTSLETANVTGLISSKVTNLEGVFNECSSLKTIEGLNTWDTSGLTRMAWIFSGCKSLESLDLSSFDCSSITERYGIIPGCDALDELILGKKWSFSLNNIYFDVPENTCWQRVSTKDCFTHWGLMRSYNGFTMSGRYVRIASHKVTVTVTGFSGSVAYNDHDSYSPGTYFSMEFSSVGSEQSAFEILPVGDDVKLTISPDYGYVVQDVTVDGADVGAVTSYSLADLSSDHDVRVTFAKDSNVESYLVTCSCGDGGNILSGSAARSCYPHSSYGCSFIPNNGYVIDDVVVDNVSQGPVTYCYFDDISKDHIIEVSFKEGSAKYHWVEEDYATEDSWGRHGHLEPNQFVVKDGDSGTLHIEEDTGWKVSDIKIDGESVGACTSYTFDNVTSDHKVAVSYEATSKTTKHVDRLSGQGALDTMKAIVDSGFFSDLDVGGTVVLATGAGYWDALTASGVAGLADAPVLLTSLDGGSLSQQTRDVLAGLKPKTIVVCGGVLAVPDAVVDAACGAAGGTPRVVRCAGQTATGTACEIYKKGASATGGWYGTTAIIATNDGYWDALAAAPYAYRTHSPIFLAEGHDRLSDETVRTMVDGGIKDAIIVGGALAVTPAVESQLEAAGIHVETRLAGDNAVLTSAEIAKYDIAHESGITGACVATTDGYWDALTGAALCGRAGDVLVLANDGDRRAIDEVALELGGSDCSFKVFGGEMAVSASTYSYLSSGQAGSGTVPSEVLWGTLYSTADPGSADSSPTTAEYLAITADGRTLQTAFINGKEQTLTKVGDSVDMSDTSGWGYQSCKALGRDSVTHAAVVDWVRPASCSWFFGNMSSLVGIDGMENLNTSRVTGASWMFYDSSALASLDLSHMDTSKITDTSGMFSQCSALASLDLSSWNASSITKMPYIFGGCSSLTRLILPSDTSKVENVEGMFYGCSGLTSLDLSSLDTSQVTNMQNMFAGCSSLASLDLSGWNVTSVTDMKSMFNGCSGLTGLKLPSGNSKVQTMECMFYGCSGLTSLDLSGLDTSSVTTVLMMFYGCSGLTSIDLSRLDTSHVTTMEDVFSGCSGLSSLDLSSFDTSHVTTMANMFSGCTALSSVTYGTGFVAADGLNTINMFLECPANRPSWLAGGDVTGAEVGGLSASYPYTGGEIVPSGVTVDVGGRRLVEGTDYEVSLSNNISPGTATLTIRGVGAYTGETTRTFSVARSGDTPSDAAWGTLYSTSDPGTTDASPTTAEYLAITRDGRALSTATVDGKEQTLTKVGDSVDMSDTSGWDYQSCKALGRDSVTHVAVVDWVRPASCAYLFEGMGSLVGIDGMGNLDTSRATVMTCMFNGCTSLTSIDLRPLDTSNVTDMSVMFGSCSSLSSLDLSSLKTSNVAGMSMMFAGCASLASLDLSPLDTSSATQMKGMFEGCSGLASLDISSLKTSKVTDIAEMFANCSGITSLDLGNLDTSNVTDLSNIFWGCTGLTSLDLSPLKTSKVETMEGMFRECSGLTSLDISPLDTSRVKVMAGMFYGCSGLTSLDLSKLDTSKVDTTGGMFYGCSGLTSLYLSKFDTSSVTIMSHMFMGCTALKSLDFSSFDTAKVNTMEGMFSGCSSLSTVTYGTGFVAADGLVTTDMFLDCPANKPSWWVGGVVSGAVWGTLYSTTGQGTTDASPTTAEYLAITKDGRTLSTATIDGKEQALTKVGDSVDMSDTSGWSLQSSQALGRDSVTHAAVVDLVHPTSCAYFFDRMSSLVGVDGMENLDTSGATVMTCMFSGCSSLASLDLTTLNTSKVTDMSYMFSNCTILASLDLTPLKTSKVTDMSWMFSYCYGLLSINLKGLDTSSVTNMRGTFSNCSGLKSIDLTGLNTSSVTDMRDMFSFCSSLEQLDLTPLNTSNVTDMGWMFCNCSGLTSLDLTPLDTAKVASMNEMFGSCKSLAALDLTPLNTSNVTTMSDMFAGCSGLTSLDLKPLDTSRVTDMHAMFAGCAGLKSLDLTPLDTSNVTDMSSMFEECGLTSLDLSPLDTSKVNDMSYMFHYCTSLSAITYGQKFVKANGLNVTDMFINCPANKPSWWTES